MFTFILCITALGFILFIMLKEIIKQNNKLERLEDDLSRLKQVRRQQYLGLVEDFDKKIESLWDDVVNSFELLCPSKPCKMVAKKKDTDNICQLNDCDKSKGKNKFWCSKDCQLKDKK